MTPPFHITFSREINIFTATLLAINLLTFVFGGGAVYDKVSSAMILARQNQESVALIQSSIEDIKIVQQRHEDGIEQLYQAIYGTPKSKARNSADVDPYQLNSALEFTQLVSYANNSHAY
jgi:hypothetical protein